MTFVLTLFRVKKIQYKIHPRRSPRSRPSVPLHGLGMHILLKKFGAIKNIGNSKRVRHSNFIQRSLTAKSRSSHRTLKLLLGNSYNLFSTFPCSSRLIYISSCRAFFSADAMLLLRSCLGGSDPATLRDCTILRSNYLKSCAVVVYNSASVVNTISQDVIDKLGAALAGSCT